MKISVIITTMLVAQVSASFMDVFQGAVLSVQNSFGKLFSDVVTDVKDTVDCTILAVEHILSLSADASARYYEKCGSKNNTSSENQPKTNLPVFEITISNNDDYLKKELPEELDARINATLTNFLNGYNPHDKLEDVQKELAKETQRLADVSDLVRKELYKLSKEIHLDLSQVERKDRKPSVDTILDELKVLEAIEQNIKNTSEANEIHRLIDDVLVKLHEIESSEAMQNDKVDGILRDLEKSSNQSYKGMRHQLDSWKVEETRHLGVIKTKIDEHEKLPEHVEYAKVNSTLKSIEKPKAAQDLPNYILQHPTRSGTTRKPVSKDVNIFSEPVYEDNIPGDVIDNIEPSHNDIENEITPWTISASSDKSSAYIKLYSNQMENTESKPANSISKQSTTTSDISTKTSPVLIFEALDTMTSAPILTSSYEKTLTDNPPLNNNIDLSEKSVESEGIVPMARSEQSSVSAMAEEVTEMQPITRPDTIASPVANQQPKTNTMKSSVTVDNPVPDFVTIPEPPNSLLLIKSQTTSNNVESTTGIQLIASLSTISPESLMSFSKPDPDVTMSPIITKETMTSFALPGSGPAYPLMPSKPMDMSTTYTDPTSISAPVQGPTTDLTVTTPESATNHVTTDEIVTDPENRELESAAPESSTKLSVAQQYTTDGTVLPDTINPKIMQKSAAITTETMTLTDSTHTPEFTIDLTVTTPESATNHVTTDEIVTDPEKRELESAAPESSTKLSVAQQYTTDGTVLPDTINPKIMQKSAAITTETMTLTDSTHTPEFTIDLTVTTPESATNHVTTDEIVTDPEKRELESAAPESSTKLSVAQQYTTDGTSLPYTINPGTTQKSAANTTETMTLTESTPISSTKLSVAPQYTTDGTVSLDVISSRITPDSAAIKTETMTLTDSTLISENTPEFTNDLTMTTLEPLSRNAQTSKLTKDFIGTATNPTTPLDPKPTVMLVTTQEPTRNLISTPIETTTNFANLTMPTVDLEATTPEGYTNPTKTSESAAEVAETVHQFTTDLIKSGDTTDIVEATTETNTKVITTLVETPKDSTTSSAIEPTAAISINEELSTTIPESASIYTTSIKIQLESITNPLVLKPETVTAIAQENINYDSISTEAKELSLPQAQPNSVILPEPTRKEPVTALEPITSSNLPPGLARSTAIFSESKRTIQDFDVPIARMPISDTTENPSVTATTTKEVAVQQAIAKIIAPNTEGLQVTAPVTNNEQNSYVTSAILTQVETTLIPAQTPTTNDAAVHLIPTSTLKTHASDMQKVSYQVTTPTPPTTSIVTTSVSTISSAETSKGASSAFVVTIAPQPKISEIMSGSLQDVTTSATPLNVVSDSLTSSAAVASKSTTGSFATTSSRVMHNLSNLKKVFHIATVRPNVPTPSLDAFLNFIDRKEGHIRPATKLPITPLPYSKTVKAENSPIKAQLNAFFSKLPSQKELLGPSKIRREIASSAQNKNTPSIPIAQSLRHLPLHGSYNENAPKGTQQPNDQHPPPGQLSDVKFTMPQILTTVNPFIGSTTPKNNFEDADYKSFFHLPSKDTEAHKRAVLEAKKLIEDSKRAHQLITNILNKKKKAINAYSLSKLLNVGK